jgi:NADP-dependent 3-hydroxy acid dehydrogenase YdfG
MRAGFHSDQSPAFAEKVCIITGASSGIGRETARALGREGARLVLAGRRLDPLRSLEEELRAEGIQALAVQTDVAREEDVARLVDLALERWGRIDVVVANAGILLRRRVSETTIEDYERLMNVNFFGVVRLILRVLPLMLEQKSGHLVVVSSVDGKKGLPPEGVYVSSKFALTGFCDILRQELRGTGVRVTTVLPARVDTPMIADLTVPWIAAKIPASTVARGIVRAIRRRRAELVVPFVRPKVLIVGASLWAPLGDWLVRLFKLGGEERTP